VATKESFPAPPPGQEAFASDAAAPGQPASAPAASANPARPEKSEPGLAAANGTADDAVEGAVEALQHGQPELAVEVLSAAARRFPDDVTVHRALGLAQYRQGRYAAAAASLQRAVTLDKSSALSYFLLSAALEKLDRLEEARAARDKAAALDPKYVTAGSPE
jgi:Flp pilus assembly protein TadD